MKRTVRRSAVVFLVFLLPGSEPADRWQELSIDPANFAALRARFGTYGYRARRTIFLEAAGIHFLLPGDVPGVSQTGMYSYFGLAGDCEATLTYELLNVPPPRAGYGSGFGLAFDVEGGAGRGAVQRVFRTGAVSGYVVQTSPGPTGKRIKEVDRLVPTEARRGRLGLRRIKNELIFLSADDPEVPLQEIDRLPFTDRTIRAVRVFADPGGSPTAVEVRLGRLEIHAEEIASGVSRLEDKGGRWLLWVGIAVLLGGGALAFWFWRRRRKHA